MGTYYFAIVERQEDNNPHWFMVSFWKLGKTFELSCEVHRINPSKGTYRDWNHVSCFLTQALGEERYNKTELDRSQLPKPRAEYGPEYASLVRSVEALPGNVRVLFCQDQ